MSVVILPCSVILFACRLRAVGSVSSARGAGWSVNCFLEEIQRVISWLPSGVVAPQTLCCPGFCSPLLSSLSWDRSARCDCVQVNLLRCQGDADRCPGHVSHYIYIQYRINIQVICFSQAVYLCNGAVTQQMIHFI